MPDGAEILLVDDNPHDVKLALHAFQRHHLEHRVKVVRDGVEALSYLFRTDQYAQRTSNDPKVVLLDLKLPQLDGLEVLQQLKATPATQSLPVIMLTTSLEKSDMDTSYRLGVNSYINKPVDFGEFDDVIRAIGHYWLSLNKLPAR